MKQSTGTFTEKNIAENSNETSVTNYNLENSFNQSKNLAKTTFEKECEDGMSVEEFRAAALNHINSLPWKK